LISSLSSLRRPTSTRNSISVTATLPVCYSINDTSNGGLYLCCCMVAHAKKRVLARDTFKKNLHTKCKIHVTDFPFGNGAATCGGSLCKQHIRIRTIVWVLGFARIESLRLTE
jgi:hypothetical protein